MLLLNEEELISELLEDKTPEFVTAYNLKMKRLQDETGEIRLARIAVHPMDGGSYQKFQKFDKVKNKYDIEKIIDENTYVISDIHFCRDESMDIPNLKLLNKVPEDATLLILGDLGYVKRACRENIKYYFNRIKCKNIFMILGNHDCYELDYYYNELGIKGVYERITIPERKWVFSHQPCDGPSIDYINFHGHIHEEIYYDHVKDTKNKINCWIG